MSTDRERSSRRALVLAGGGIVGGLYEVGALLALDSLFENFTTCDFDIYVGASAGAFVSALLANHVTPQRLRETLEGDRRTLPRLAGSQFLHLPWRSYLGVLPRLAAALPRLGRDLWVHWNEALVLETLGSLLRVLPHGLFTLDGLDAYVHGVLTQGGRTNDFRHLKKRLLIPATVLDTGAIRVFGARLNERTPISRAVAASAAVPILFEPVTIDGIDYVDAAVTKTAHSSLAVDRGANLVITINPLRPLVLDASGPHRVRTSGLLGIASQALRIGFQRRLHDSTRHYADVDTVLLEPYERDLELFDTPLMTYGLRHEVIRRGYRTTTKTFLANFEYFQALLARHDITLSPRPEVERRAKRWSSAARNAA
jgi:predicted acylesterase/phospholipase RssA